MTLYENEVCLPSMEANFEITFDGIIWNTCYESSKLCIETRNGESLDTVFHVMDLTNLDCIGSFKGCFDKWMSGLENIHQESIIIHGYDKEQNIHKKGLALYSFKGDLLHQFDYLTFQFFNNNSIIAIDPNEKLVAIENGDLFEFQPEDKTNRTIKPDEVTTPIHYTSEDLHFKTLITYINNSFNKEAVHAVDYLEVNNKILISFYIYQGSKLNNEFILLSQEGEVLYTTVLDNELSGIGYGTFFVIKNMVYFIRNKKTLLGIEL